MVDYFQALGVSVPRLLAGTGLTQSNLNDPDTDILARQELRLVANILAQVSDAQAHATALGNRYHYSAYGLWGYGLVCCNTVEQALALALKYLPLTYAFSGVDYREDGDQAVLSFTPPPLEPDISQFLLARDMVAAVLLVRELVGDSFNQIVNSPVSYGAGSNDVVFPKKLLDRSLPQANAVTAAMCEQQCRELIHRRRISSGVTADVEQFLRGQRWQKPVLAEVAQYLNMSERSLKRHLQQEGASFRELVEQYRSSEACRLLQQHDLLVSEIALRLGFSDTSTFSQAFKRWHGISPSSYQKKCRNL
ncbi:AraC family transcriptional regulator ligand-binding domain-containing protein [Marinobacter sp.]|uniref:AraC family transcriptional regulator n=1 Tax=Marinobacter sp. TaxID=50741 RepID=UPI003566D554